MGRKRNIFIRDFYDYDPNTKSSVCKACSAKFMGEHTTNLRRHMIQAHIELYKQEAECLEDNLEEKGNEQKTKFTVIMSRKQITDSCMDLITKHSLPLTFFDSSAFGSLTQQLFEGLKMQPINSHNIQEILKNRYFRIKTHIVKLTKDHLLSIKLDKATLRGRTVLCINMQILENKKLVIYTLAIKDIENGSTNMKFIKNLLEKVLDEFEISMQQIYSVTMDYRGDRSIDCNLEEFRDSEDMEEENMLTPDVPEHPQKTLVKIESGLDVNNEDNSFADILEQSTVVTLKCAADVIQLAIEDFFSEPDIEYIIQCSRDAVETLRDPSFRNTLELLNIEKPLKDQPKQWFSTFKMLETLLKIQKKLVKTQDPLEKEDVKDVLLKHLKEPLQNLNWPDIEELVELLQPVQECVILLQKQQLFLVDFYKSWLNLKSNLKSNPSEKYSFLHSCLENREPQLFKYEVLNSARFLDPLLYRTLDPYEKDNARTHLKELMAKLVLCKNHKGPDNSKPLTSSSSQNYIWDETSNSSLLRELSVKPSTKERSETEINQLIKAGSDEIDLYNPPLLDVDLMEYWDEKKFILPNLRKLAYIIHAVPLTQISMEKTLTALQYKMEKQKASISDDMLDTITFIKLNQHSEEE